MEPIGANEIEQLFKARMGNAILSSHVDIYEMGKRRKKLQTVWLRVPRENLRDAVAIVAELQSPPHIAVASGSDLGDDIEILYHFQVFWGFGRESTVSVTVGTTCPKSDPHLPTISDMAPGAVITEREKQEFFGVIIDGIPDPRRLFLTESIPEGMYPWRKDEKGVDSLVRDVHEGGD
ncbi:MAG: NADH-quinone oxidoreductase subunit C [Thermoplasmata archaeon]